MMSTANQRRDKIRELLRTHPHVTLAELEAMFPDVSSMTLRRDIDYFESIGEAIKVRGGARSTRFITNATDDSITARMTENVTSKEKIARRAADFLETGCSVFIDSGSTLASIVPYVPNDRFIFTTTNPQVALDLCNIGTPVVNIVGGRLDRDYRIVYGPQAMHFLSEMNIDTAFLSASGLSAKSGCTGGNSSECEFKKAVVAKARQVILLVDGSKIGKSLPYTFCSLERIDIIITDGELPSDIRAAAEASGTKIINVNQ